MIFISNAEGTIVKVVPSPIQQGTNEGNEVVLLAPFTGSVNLLCTLPNGTRLTGKTMEGIFDDSIDELTENRLHGWRILLPDAVTEYPGNLQIQFEVTVSNGDGQTSRPYKTDVSNVWIKPGVYEIKAEEGDSDLNLKLAAATAAAIAAEGYREGAEAWAVGTCYGETLAAPEETDETYKTTSHAENNAKYYAEQAEVSKVQAGDSAGAASGSASNAKTSENEAKAWAVGNDEGTEQHNNNAMYYADQASDFASDASGSAKDASDFSDAAKSARNDAEGFKKTAEEKAGLAEGYYNDVSTMKEQIGVTYENISDLKKEISVLETQTKKYANSVEETKTKLDNITKIMDFRGPVETKPTDLSDYQDGDVIAVTAGTDAGKEFVLWEDEWIELGDTSTEHQSISELQTAVAEHGNAIDDINAEIASNHKELKLGSITNSGWYRIAETYDEDGKGVANYNNLIHLSSSGGGRHTTTIFATSGNYGTAPEIVPIISTNHNTASINAARILYPTSGNPSDTINYYHSSAYLEVYLNNTLKTNADGTQSYPPISLKLSTLINRGWTFRESAEFVSADFNSAAPSGYRAITQTFDNDINEVITALSNKLDIVKNNGNLNQVYVAQKNGEQAMYKIASHAMEDAGVWRDSNGYSQVKTPTNAVGNFIINAEYLNSKLENVGEKIEAITEQDIIDITVADFQ